MGDPYVCYAKPTHNTAGEAALWVAVEDDRYVDGGYCCYVTIKSILPDAQKPDKLRDLVLEYARDLPEGWLRRMISEATAAAGSAAGKPTPEFRQVCRRVLGDDDDETVVAVLTGDDHQLIAKLLSEHMAYPF
jgi:hypothetical protein